MKLRYQLYIFQIVLSALVFLILIFNYYSYKKQYELDIQKYLKEEISLHKKEILSSINKANKEFDKQKNLFYQVHEKALKLVQENKNINLEKLKQQLKDDFDLKNIDLEIYLINKHYTIYKTTYPKDLSFNLSVAADAKYYLDETSKDGKIYISKFASTDSLNMNYKLYSYSKLDENSYFELGFIDKQINNTAMTIISDNLIDRKITIYNVGKNDKGFYYYDMIKARDINKKENFFNSLETIAKDKISTNKITNSALNFKEESILKNNIQTIYSPIFEKNMYNILGFENVIMELKVDLKDKFEFIKDMEKLFATSIIIIGLFLIIVFFFIKKRFTTPTEKILKGIVQFHKIEDSYILNLDNELTQIALKYNDLFDKLNNEIKNNKLLLEENKRFISDTVHQIRTPLTNIMMNGEMVKKFQNDDSLSVFIDQIDASINMLSNSYEDLAYIISCDYIEYKVSKVSISQKLEKRAKFFNTISKVNNKDINTYIENELFILINEIELERIIDNNISNAIKYSTKELPIEINLIKKENIIYLQFISYGIEIENKISVFEKNYREHEAKRGLGLGLNMVKNICLKYDISYRTYYENNRNIFEYGFKIYH